MLSLLDQSTVVEQLKTVDIRTVKIPRLPERVLLIDTDESPRWLDITVTGSVPCVEYPFLFEDKSFLIKVPTMIYQVRWNTQERTLQSLRLAVTTDEQATVDSPLYRWPFSNVYVNSNVCWNVPKVECELHQIVEKVVFAFLQTRNNRDLFGVGTSQNSPYQDYAEFLQSILDNGNVPVAWMIPLGKSVHEFHEVNRRSRSHY